MPEGSSDTLWSLIAADKRCTQRAVERGLWQLVDDVLADGEVVHALLYRVVKNDTRPVLLVTDRRILAARRRAFRGWRVEHEVAAQDVAGASWRARGITLRVEVHARSGPGFTVKTRVEPWAKEVVALVDRLVAGSAPPPAG